MSKPQLTHGSLFAGIGGFDLGFERAGFKTVWQVERSKFCQQVLSKHFPNVERFDDVQQCDGLKPVDVITGGFPCQDISEVGLRAGISGVRSGLWGHMLRIVCELRPSFAVVENVAALLIRGIDVVLGGLAAIGYDAEWMCIPAAFWGAPHLRERIWIVAYPAREQGVHESGQGNVRPILDADSLRAFRDYRAWPAAPDPELCRVDDGIPHRVDRHSALGNALLPIQAQWIAERIKTQIEIGQ